MNSAAAGCSRGSRTLTSHGTWYSLYADMVSHERGLALTSRPFAEHFAANAVGRSLHGKNFRFALRCTQSQPAAI